jgi:hypothetical protein
VIRGLIRRVQSTPAPSKREAGVAFLGGSAIEVLPMGTTPQRTLCAMSS